MKILINSLFLLIQLSFIFGSTVVAVNKCWLWDSPCLRARAQAFVPTISAGIPELGIEPLDVMVFDGLHINEDDFKHIWNTTYVHGLKFTMIDELSVDLDLKQVHLVFHSNLLTRSHYVEEGYLFDLPIEGAGAATMDFDNIQMDIVMSFDIVKDIHGRDIVDLKGFRYWYDMQDLRMYFDNLYYGKNDELSRKMHMLINENWKELILRFGRYLFDKTNSKIFNALRTILHLKPLETFCLF